MVDDKQPHFYLEHKPKRSKCEVRQEEEITKKKMTVKQWQERRKEKNSEILVWWEWPFLVIDL